MTRIAVEPGWTVLDVAASVCECTSAEAEEAISRFEGFNGFDQAKRIVLKRDDLAETVHDMKRGEVKR